jgi:hypothetical protein
LPAGITTLYLCITTSAAAAATLPLLLLLLLLARCCLVSPQLGSISLLLLLLWLLLLLLLLCWASAGLLLLLLFAVWAMVRPWRVLGVLLPVKTMMRAHSNEIKHHIVLNVDIHMLGRAAESCCLLSRDIY